MSVKPKPRKPFRIRRTYIFAAFLVLAAVLAVLPIKGNRLADTFRFCTIYAIYAGLILFWIQLVRNRLLPSRSRRYIILSAVLMLFFLLLRTYRYRISAADTGLIAWYCYYIPLIFSPTFFLMSCIRFRRAEDASEIDEHWLLLPATLIELGILTNNHFHLAFVPHPWVTDFKGEAGTYTYSLFFYLAYGWAILMLAAGIMYLLRVSRRLHESKMVYMPFLFIFIWITLLLLLELSERKGFPFPFRLPEIHIFCMLGVFETCIRLRLMLVNNDYSSSFASLHLPAVITNRDLTPVFRTAVPLNATPEQLRAALGGPILTDEDTRLHCNPIPAGYVYWTTDESAVHRLRSDLEAANETISMENELLRYENEQKTERARIDARNRLYARAAAEVYPAQKRIEALIAQAQPNTPEFRDTMAEICLMNAYVKRRANFVLLAEERDRITAVEMHAALRESAICLGYCGIAATVDAAAVGDFSYSEATALFDSYETVAEALLGHATFLWIGIADSGLTLIADRLPQSLPDTPVASKYSDEDGQFRLTFRREGGTAV